MLRAEIVNSDKSEIRSFSRNVAISFQRATDTLAHSSTRDKGNRMNVRATYICVIEQSHC